MITLEKDEKKSVKTVEGTKVQLIVFKLGNEEYGLPIDQIKEVVLTPNITRLPQTPSFVKGVANIRGNIIAIVDLEEKFGLEQVQGKDLSDHYTLVLESEDLKVGILVKEVPNTLRLSSSEIEDASNIIHEGSGAEQYIRGIVKVDQKLIIMIDVFKVFKGNELNEIFGK